MFLRFYSTFLTLFLVSCSSLSNKENAQEKQIQTSQTEEQILENVSNKLKRIVAATKKDGREDQINYLASDLYLKASAAQIQGDFQTANMIYKNLSELVPNNNFLEKKYSVSLIRDGKLKESQVLLEAITERTKYQDTDSSLLLAGIYSTLGKNKKADDIYKKVLSFDSKNEDACVFYSKSQASQGFHTKAIKTLKSCQSKDPKNGIFSYYLGKVYLDKNNVKKAKYYLNKSLKITPELFYSTLALGDIYEKAGEAQKAAQVFEDYLSFEPNHQMVLSRLVNNLFSREKYDEVLPYAQRLSDLDQSDLNLKVKLGILYTDTKEYDQAIGIFSEILKEVPGNDKMLYYLGAIYQETKQIDSAVSFYSKIDVDSGLYSDSSLQVASMLSTQARTEYQSLKTRAQKHSEFKEFVAARIKSAPSVKIELSVIAANYLESVGLAADSIQFMENISKESNFSDDHRYYLASLYEKEQDFKRSYDIIEGIIKTNPTDAYAYNFIGYSLVQREVEMDKAEKYLTKAMKLSPNDGYIKDSLGWYYYKVGNEQKALELLELAVKIEPKDLAIQKHIAIVYSKLKAFSKAKNFIKNALELAQTEHDKKELESFLKDLSLERIPASFK